MNFDLTEEQKTWKKIVHEFAEKELRPKAREVDEKEEFNWEAFRKAGPVGLTGMSIPEEYGGSNVDMISNAIAFEELGWGCGSTALAFTAHNGLGTAPIALYGSEELKKKWLSV
ncbi:MAG: acyl-CoA dehydrogenase family protein [Chloroflexi bacterium]|nr:acyl-CoA dehydrogenase family protein [Chloroflexota bacterium]